MSKPPYSNRLLVTVFSDASVKDGQAGFGYWFKSTFATGHGAEPSDRIFPHVGHAELVGILVALRAAKAAHPDQDCDYLVQCDNVEALAALATIGGRSAKSSPIRISPRSKIRPAEQGDLGLIRTLVGGSRLWLKHVKGHQGNSCKRSFINNLTDRLSRVGRERAEDLPS